jgi:hypothetical protein
MNTLAVAEPHYSIRHLSDRNEECLRHAQRRGLRGFVLTHRGRPIGYLDLTATTAPRLQAPAGSYAAAAPRYDAAPGPLPAGTDLEAFEAEMPDPDEYTDSP